MGDWLSYTLSDFLLFSARTYYRLFELYNRAIWPAQILALLLGLVVLWRLHRAGAWQGSMVTMILAAGWLWTAWAYLLEQYDTINWAARYFAIGFVFEALLLIWLGAIQGRRFFRPYRDWSSRAGLILFLFALVIQPLIGLLVGRDWKQTEIFGIAPDPTVLATLGILLTMDKWPPWGLMIIPLIWCALSGATLWTMGSPDAWVMPVAALIALGLAVSRVLSARGQDQET
ncbi:hypothetical protein AA309_18510 [Microvirga vignae]|uniref:MFS transporter permease n=1 Tax=Microvirga vignae TaxID=1225564 RepID=A0A0H1RGI6_9HYPH|nr:DUF6064 family protein [Microvirga vignae]KLK91747.1 hypothetical protein AA309_18510 [Microvirga vignae]